jgi:ABC-type multidrug transport system ATPase subunit
VGLLALGLVVAPLAVVVHRRQRVDRASLARSQKPPQWQPGALASCPPTLAVCRLTKVYPSAAARGTATGLRGGFRALDAASFRLEPGITGLLGPNGAGKSTLLRILAGLVEPTRGGVELAGVRRSRDNRAAYRSLVGYVPQDLNAYQGFTAREFLDHWARSRGLDACDREPRIALALEAVDLVDHADRRVRDFSGGMRRRVGVAQALLGAPRILVLDEPTAGLDVTARGQFRELLQGLAADRIVVVSTHIASDLEALARYVVVVDGGQVRFEGSVDALVASARGRVFRTVVAEEELRAFSRTFATTSRVRTLEGFVVRAVAPPDQPCEGEEVEPNLEEAYLVHVGARRQPAQVFAGGTLASVSV